MLKSPENYFIWRSLRKDNIDWPTASISESRLAPSFIFEPLFAKLITIACLLKKTVDDVSLYCLLQKLNITRLLQKIKITRKTKICKTKRELFTVNEFHLISEGSRFI